MSREYREVPKLKSHRGAAKRFRRTAGGGYKRSCAYANHILTKKTRKNKRRLRKGTSVHRSDANRIKEMLPYSV